ncbi:MAG: hypothetical protein AABZ57_05370 [Candidatus Margulisiibacteriota bacterium]
MNPAQMVSINPAKPRVLTGEDALSVLNLVNVDGEVLNIPALKKDAAALTKIAAEIIKTRKNGGQIEFENGRIHIPKQQFESIVRSAESPQKGPEQMFTASGQTNSPNVGMLANTTVLNDPASEMTYRKGDASGASSVESAGAGIIPHLTLYQAYSMLVKIAAPNGARYVMHGEYDGAPEKKQELEASLERFWNDFGHTISVNGKHTCFVIRPKMIIGANVNSEVSKKLAAVSLSQSNA